MGDGQFEEKNEHSQRRRKSSGAGLILTIALFYFAWLIFYSFSIGVLKWDESWAVFIMDRWVRAGFSLYLFLIFVEIILLAAGRPERRYEKYEKEEGEREVILPMEPDQADILGGYDSRDYGSAIASGRMIHLKRYKPAEGALAIHNYPKTMNGGMYGVDYVPVDYANVLKIRSVLAQPCALCEQRDSCFEKYRDRISEKDFYENLDCVEGLETLASHNSWENYEWENA